MDDYGNELPATTLQQVNKRFNQGSERMAAIERDLKVLAQGLHEERQELQELKQQLAEMLEFFTAMKGAFKVLNWVAKVAKPLAAIVMLGGACVSFWAAIKGVTSR
ncbi:hypothetical protein Cthiooxydans_15550 [Comamonas thiooxydans]|uniref:hypothetical protein n=1 Tax=Comamonas thiooxydans TaxID=363952 RepID=UPI001E57CDA4|nr:hypothetical protein [Comamonas thiooxydans]BDB69143.1 hypothetical protein Cthiooxydans_15550 [Comamonas thiooxydans]